MANHFEKETRLEVVDLVVDFGDGVLLMNLLEIVSGEKIGWPISYRKTQEHSNCYVRVNPLELEDNYYEEEGERGERKNMPKMHFYYGASVKRPVTATSGRPLEAEDVDAARPDENSVIICMPLYHHFPKRKTELNGGG
ncbi:unnamed protein product [Angiostrongylus costaricensis]|uniref:Calponin-homology (CH) domain-containing protein n=1 Tax=Angiostrongylus costaricensis TaxID=334426 RepID=A0A0R3PIG8_ANGCS|nr:unnamed protein product [Angiostrongylus costaricensis]